MFIRDVEQAESWMQQREAFLASEDVGSSLDAVEALVKKQEEVEKSLQSEVHGSDGGEGWRRGGMKEGRDGGGEGWRRGGMEEGRDGGGEGWRRGVMEEGRNGRGEGWRRGGMEEGGMEERDGGGEGWRRGGMEEGRDGGGE